MTGRFLLRIASAAALVLAPSTALADEDAAPLVLKPSSNWHLYYAEDKCRLARAFGEGEQQTLFYIEQFEPSSGYQWTVAGPPITHFRQSRPVITQFGESKSPFEVESKKLNMEGFGDVLSGGWIDQSTEQSAEDSPDDLSPEELARVPEDARLMLDAQDGERIEWISFSQKNRQTAILRTGPLKAAYSAMNDCAKHLLASWGIDPDEHSEIAMRPIWTNREDTVRKIVSYYPSKAAQRGEQGIFSLRIIVDESGAVESCKMANITIADSFDQKACEIINKHSEFTPALDRNGVPIKSYYINTILYTLG